MTESELDRIEEALGLTLPDHYRAFMADYPRWLLDQQPSWLRPVTEWDFADNPDRIIEFNRYVREQDEDTFFDDDVWPDEFFVIGNESNRNLYLIDRFSEGETVFRWSGDDGRVEPIADSLAEFRDKLRLWYDEWKRGAEADDAARARKQARASDN